ncbi:hypothetical protein [Helicobacter suis]|uniref:hypothetical protein n=1 Tax=Helicobacter suis TaxID=104628 RepID=UPI0013D6F554|nr:hypothetical protein [Helicobacter suis]
MDEEILEVEVLENLAPIDMASLLERAYHLGLQKGRLENKATKAPTPKQAPKNKPIYSAQDFYKEFGTDKPDRGDYD